MSTTWFSIDSTFGAVVRALSSWLGVAIDIFATESTISHYSFYHKLHPNHHVVLLMFLEISNHHLSVCNISPSKRLKLTSASTQVSPPLHYFSLQVWLLLVSMSHTIVIFTPSFTLYEVLY